MTLFHIEDEKSLNFKTYEVKPRRKEGVGGDSFCIVVFEWIQSKLLRTIEINTLFFYFYLCATFDAVKTSRVIDLTCREKQLLFPFVVFVFLHVALTLPKSVSYFYLY